MSWYTQEGGPIIDTLNIPDEILCIVRAREGVVWMRDSHPRLRWLADADLDAWAATVGPEDTISGRRTSPEDGASGSGHEGEILRSKRRVDAIDAEATRAFQQSLPAGRDTYPDYKRPWPARRVLSNAERRLLAGRGIHRPDDDAGDRGTVEGGPVDGEQGDDDAGSVETLGL